MINLMIGGAVKHKSSILTFILKNKNMCKNIHITVYDGFEGCSWNGGRINRENISLTDKEIELYYNHGINIALTFSNKDIDLNDEIGNYLLKKFHKNGNKIILTNLELNDYIKINYPLYETIFSITGLGDLNIPMTDQDVEKYKKLETLCDFIVPRMEHIFDEKFIELTQNKYEIMLNDTCIYKCPYYKEHFELIAKQNKTKNPWKTIGHHECFKIEECWINGFDPNIGHIETKEKYGDNYGMDLTIKQVNKLKERGVMSFKITGRENSSDDIINELNKYLKVISC